MDILNPPKSYIDWRCSTHDWEVDPNSTVEEFESIQKKFYKQFNGVRDEIETFCKELELARRSRSLPIEKIELREGDGKKRGNVVPAMIHDIQYWRVKRNLFKRKIYML